MLAYQSDPLFWQRFLKSAGFYQGQLDGLFGPKSNAAARCFEDASQQLAVQLGQFSPRTENNIRSLQPIAQRPARLLLKRLAEAAGPEAVRFEIISGTRTYAEQDALYRQGRDGNPGPIVTRARGGQSNHNFGLAWDIGVFENGRYMDESPWYARAGQIGKSLGLTWGGDWKSIQDQPHFQVVAESGAIRQRFEAGEVLGV